MKKVTLEDIAAELHISKSLVSKALRNVYGVNEKTRHTIILTALNMGYDISKLNSAEITETNNILLLVECSAAVDANFVMPVINGIERALYRQNYNINISTYQIEGELDKKNIDNILDRNCAGIIILGRFSLSFFQTIAHMHKPYVLIDPPMLIPHADRVMADNFGGAAAAVRYLYEKGHRHIAFVGSVSYSLSFQERYSGYLYAMREMGLPAIELTGGHENYVIPLNREQLRQYLQAEKPTALFCANDAAAVLACGVLEELHLSIPSAISIMGFDNSFSSVQTTPPLTTVDIPRLEIGQTAVEILLRRIRSDTIPHSVTSLCISSIVERDSVRDLNLEQL